MVAGQMLLAVTVSPRRHPVGVGLLVEEKDPNPQYSGNLEIQDLNQKKTRSPDFCLYLYLLRLVYHRYIIVLEGPENAGYLYIGCHCHCRFCYLAGFLHCLYRLD